MLFRAAVMLLLVGAWGCLPNEPFMRNNTVAPDITGTWQGTSEEGEAWTLEIRRLGVAKLEVNGEHHDLNYSYVFEGKMLPLKLDLYGFRTGEYVGKTIYGIVMFRDEDTMRFETQVGEPMADGTRPEKFDKSSVRLMKRAKS